MGVDHPTPELFSVFQAGVGNTETGQPDVINLLIAPKNLLFGGIHGAYVYSSMRHEVGVGERENPSASLPEAAPERRKKYAGFWSLPLTKPYLGTVTSPHNIHLHSPFGCGRTPQEIFLFIFLSLPALLKYAPISFGSPRTPLAFLPGLCQESWFLRSGYDTLIITITLSLCG